MNPDNCIPRDCFELIKGASNQKRKPLADYRDCGAYILLGEPGMGKTTSFDHEAQETPNGCYVSARDFIDGIGERDWSGKTLFIDGLDEARAEGNNTAIGAVRRKIYQLDCKRFRISCRAADWRESDRGDLSKICAGELTVLELAELSGTDMYRIIANSKKIPDARDFLSTAREMGVGGLITNPQTLNMLIDAVSGNEQKWPVNKQQVFELACAKMVEESNPIHAQAQEFQNDLLDAAGLICAVQLLGNQSRLDFNEIKKWPIEEKRLQNSLGNARKTRLFKTKGEYVHRSIAEYLAAKFIDRKIKAGLLPERVLAICAGYDGGVVTALRGLLAWLSVFNEYIRDSLIAQDALGIVLYADAEILPPEYKGKLLKQLIADAERNRLAQLDWFSNRFTSLIAPETESLILSVLERPCRTEAERFLTYMLLKGLVEKEPLAGLKSALLAIVLDKKHISDMRCQALSCYIKYCRDNAEELLELLERLRNLPPDRNEAALIDSLLDKLFPGLITIDTVFDYRVKIDFCPIISSMFWEEFPSKINDDELPHVLDVLSEKPAGYIDEYFYGLAHVFGELLLKALHMFGNTISNDRLYDWLSIGLDQCCKVILNTEHARQITDWLEAHESRCFGLLTAGISRLDTALALNPMQDWEINWDLEKIAGRWYGANITENPGSWWLERALLVSNTSLAKCCFIKAFCSKPANLARWVKQHPQFLDVYQDLLQPFPKVQDPVIEKSIEQRRERENEILNQYLAHLPELADGTAPPGLYEYMTQFMDDGFFNSNKLPKYLSENQALMTAMESGLAKIIYREDVPDAVLIFAAEKNQRRYLIARPFVAGINRVYKHNPDIINQLNRQQLAKALAFCFTLGKFSDEWFLTVCRQQPEWVANLYLQYYRKLIHLKSVYLNGVNHLSQHQECAPVFRLSLLPILEKFPVRSWQQRNNELLHLLLRATELLDKDILLKLATKKLAFSSMDITQRMYWLATGFAITPGNYFEQVGTNLFGNPQRVSCFAKCFFYLTMHNSGLVELPPLACALLIRLFGASTSAIDTENIRENAVFSYYDIAEQDYVKVLLATLESNPGDESANALDSLLHEPALLDWRPLIERAAAGQQLARRDATFHYPGVAQVINTLLNANPANVDDIAALAMDCFRELAKEMHTTNTNRYEQFWEFKSKQNPIPIDENRCRNRLVDLITDKLQHYGILVELEAYQPNNKRADIKLSAIINDKRRELPIEIKCDYHPKLWTAMENQLINQYCISADCDGRGIYLVLWFNARNSEKKPQKRDAYTPLAESAMELEDMLKSQLNEQQRLRIKVLVLDVSLRTGNSGTDSGLQSRQAG